jgi:hypothetical protein
MCVSFFDLWSRRIDPYGGYGTLDADLLLAFAALLFVTIMLCMWLYRLWKYTEARQSRQKSALFLLAAIAIVFTTIVLNHAEIPFRIAFACSRHSLERSIAELRADPAKTMAGKTIGAFTIESVRIDGIHTSVFVSGAGFDVTHALLFTPSPWSGIDAEPLGGNWYFTRSFMPPP